MLRTHDVVLLDGTFRVLLTPKRRVVAVIDAPTTPLGPLHIALQLDRSSYLPPHFDPRVLEEPSYATAGFLDDIGHAVSHAAEGAFNAASKVATTIARPVFDVTKAAAGAGAQLIAHATPFLPEHVRRQMDQAAHVIMRARLGDVTAKQFINTIASAANAGVQAARHVGDALLDAHKLMFKALDVPVLIASQIPGASGIVKALSPFEHFERMTDDLKKGDFKDLEKMAKQDLQTAQGVISLFPGIGTGISAAIGAGLAILDGGGALEIAIKTAYGMIPIPPGIRQVTDTVLDAVLALIEHPNDLSEVAIQVVRDKIPAGLPRDVFDTLAHIVVKHVPIQKAAGQLAEHFVAQYAPALGGKSVEEALKGLHVDDALKGLHVDQAIKGLHLDDALKSGVRLDSHGLHVDPGAAARTAASAAAAEALKGVHAEAAIRGLLGQVPGAAALAAKIDGAGRMVQPFSRLVHA